MPSLNLIWPAVEHLSSYRTALVRGWSANNIRDVAAEELSKLDADPAGFVAGMVDREAAGPAVQQRDGSMRPRIPGYRKWMWDGEFCGTISFRWVPYVNTLPMHVSGHIGYSVVPWKQRLGYATRALGLLLPDARAEGLVYVDITTHTDNLASQRVILANGGRLIATVDNPLVSETPLLLFRIILPP